jgi:uncharacterized protein (DUF302 family)
MPNASLKYGHAVRVRLSYEQALDRARALLKEEGFGVLCDVDVTATLKEKIGADFRRYRILGACNPSLAHQALERESQLGLLLPCNVVVQELDGTTIVSAIDARALLSLVGNSELLQVADEVNGGLRRTLERLEALAKAGQP